MQVTWATPNSGGAEWTVSVTDTRTRRDLDGCQGRCFENENTICLNRDTVARSEMPLVRFHEEYHMAMMRSGARGAVQNFLGIDDEKMERLEELLNLTHGQAVYDYLNRNGYLQYESLPPYE